MAVALQTKQHNVGGVMLDRPFKVRRLGHFGFNNSNMEESLRFYTELLGFRISDTMDFRATAKDPSVFDGVKDTTTYFMRYGGDHHAFVLGSKAAAERPP